MNKIVRVEAVDGGKEMEEGMNYKGFDKNMQCRGFQYEVGKEYETEDAAACKTGFHACEYPLDVLNYYAPAESQYAVVEQSGKISKSGGDTKVASTKIKIVAEIGIAGLVKAAVEYTKTRAKEEPGGHATGNQGAASATGYLGAASATGYLGAASATGYQGAASATGDRGAASATGYQGAASATGDLGAASATGDRGAASATGKAGVALAAGFGCKAKGAIGCAICVVERGNWDGETYPIINIKAAIVDGDIVKADTYYMLINGAFVEA